MPARFVVVVGDGDVVGVDAVVVGSALVAASITIW